MKISLRKMRTLFLFFMVLLVAGCSSLEQKKVVEKNTAWTLEFTWLKNDKPIEIKSYEFQSRIDCFNAMYRMQNEAKKIRYQSGAGLCYKEFADGQERTSDDQLAMYTH
jgi:uncharacterized protein YcfL